MKYTPEIIERLIKEYNEGKSLPALSRENNTPLKYLRRVMKGKIAKRPYKEYEQGTRFKNTHETFLSKIIKGDCWEWQGRLSNKGYGQFAINGKGVLAHRYSYSYYTGDCTNMCVCHKCDNPKCVNPDHLFLGDREANQMDMASKGRAPNQKLTEKDVMNIRVMFTNGIGCRKIAAQYNVSKQAIQSIKNRKTWYWVK